jgi:Rrf2 family iron-sulfur cluster assembly transcriptional regulator
VILSQTALYALRATLCLAAHEPSEPVRVDDIAQRLDVPRNYLSKVLHVLARSGVLVSSRGPGGGFQLARPASEVTLAAVVEQFDEVSDDPYCLLGRPQCSDQNPCSAHDEWRSVSLAVNRFFRQTSIADLSRDHRRPSTEDSEVAV